MKDLKDGEGENEMEILRMIEVQCKRCLSEEDYKIMIRKQAQIMNALNERFEHNEW